LNVTSGGGLVNRMVEQFRGPLDAVFHALADPTRRRMLADLAAGERSVGELAAPSAMTFAGASKHVKVLERAGLVRRRVEGRTHKCRLAPEPLGEAQAWLRRYERSWSERLDALERELRAADASEEEGDRHG
jgi:DNA-binding transcriptional ArsR family regulator